MLLSRLARPPFRPYHAYRTRARFITNDTLAEIARIKSPHRGGQNLTSRYQRLENMVRGKAAQTRQIEELPARSAVVTQAPYTTSVKTFRGLVLPEEPTPPEPDECCMSGCAICVHDLHQESLAAYDESVAALRTSLGALGVPQAEWPASIRTSTVSADAPRKNVSGDTFAAMERTLQAKKEAQSSNVSTTRQRAKKSSIYSLEDIYEALRWLFFSNR